MSSQTKPGATALTSAAASQTKPSRATVLVYCANGLQGRGIVPQLLAAGLQVRGMVSDAGKADILRDQGAEVVQASLDDAGQLARAHSGVHAVLLQLPATDDANTITKRGELAISAMNDAGIDSVILHTSVQFPRHLDELPHFKAKQRLQERLTSSGLKWSVIRPSGFMLQNFLQPAAAHAIAGGGALAYPVAADLPLSWFGAEDVGSAAAVLLNHHLNEQVVDLGLQPPLTGTELAEAFSNVLDRQIHYIPMPVAAWEQAMQKTFGQATGAQLAGIFNYIGRHPDDLHTLQAPYDHSLDSHGFQPTPITTWIHRHRHTFSPHRPTGRDRAEP